MDIKNTTRRLLKLQQVVPPFLCPTQAIRGLHSTAPCAESERKRAARLKKRSQRAKRVENTRIEKLNKPHPALGFAPGHEHVWKDSKLAKTIITQEQVDSLESPQIDAEGEYEELLDGDRAFNFGIGPVERQIVFQEIPALHTEATLLNWQAAERKAAKSSDSEIVEEGEETKEIDALKQERSSKLALARVIDLKNANAAGISFENRRKIVEAFSTPAKPLDTGRPEVQGRLYELFLFLEANESFVAALLTYQIHTVWEHLLRATRDIHNRRNLILLVHQRAKLLQYLRRTQRQRYENLLPDLGLEKGAVEGEITIPRTIYKRTQNSY